MTTGTENHKSELSRLIELRGARLATRLGTLYGQPERFADAIHDECRGLDLAGAVIVLSAALRHVAGVTMPAVLAIADELNTGKMPPVDAMHIAAQTGLYEHYKTLTEGARA